MILLIDTCTKFCSVGLLGQVGQLFVQDSLVKDIGTGHAETLPSLIQDILQKHGLKMADLEALMVNVGPGSFAGVRVGVATARGLSLALKIPIISYTGFDAYLQKAHRNNLMKEGQIITVLWDAKRHEVYGQTYHLSEGAFSFNSPPQKEPVIWHIDQLDEVIKKAGANLVLGAGAVHLPVNTGVTLALIEELPTTQWMIEGTDLDWVKNCLLKASWHPSPLYIRPPDAKPSVKLWEALSFDD